jgi:hypothetical protein
MTGKYSRNERQENKSATHAAICRIQFVTLYFHYATRRLAEANMKNAKLKQFALSLLALLSLFVSASAACACTHHQAKQETDSPAAASTSCHEHSEETQTGENGGNTVSPETSETRAFAGGCVCFQSAPKVFAKSETVKFEKRAAAIAALTPPELVPVLQTAPVKIDFNQPFYLSDSFYNLSPGRAPPVL